MIRPQINDPRQVLLSGRLSVGCVAPAQAKDVTALERGGAASLWTGGHVASPNPGPEALGWLARLAVQSQTAVIGTGVLLLPLYPPAIVAKLVADLDNAAEGRVALGVGVGGEYPQEFEASGVPLAGRGQRTEEAIRLIRELWSGQPTSWEGPLFPMTHVRIHPAPLQAGGPPIIVAGRKPVAMRRAALLGDGWMPYLYSPERYARSVEYVMEAAAAAGRSLAGFGWLAYLPVYVDPDGRRARERAAEFLGGTYRQDFAEFIDRVAVAGTPDEVGERLQAFVDAGARHLVLLPTVRSTGTEMLLEILSDIVPGLRQP